MTLPREADGNADDEAEAAAVPGERWELRLYVIGNSPKSVRAIANLQRICVHWLPGRHHIQVVDLLENPSLAADDQIVAVPTVVRKLPQPTRKIVGDLTDTESLLVAMQLRPKPARLTGESR
jgi:circadian clock protein KaiB